MAGSRRIAADASDAGTPGAGSPDADSARAGATAGPGSAVDGEEVPDSGASPVPTRPNPISRTVDDMVRLIDEIDHAREELMARGIENQTLNVLVEFGLHKREEGREMLLEAALASATEAYGVNAIDRGELERRLAELLSLELDVSHARRIARQQGIDLQVLNFMTRLIQKNPGDGGERSINAFFGYALACGIPLAGIEQVVQRVGGEPKSVLPDIDRAAYGEERWTWATLLRDAAFGLCLGVGMLWLLT